MKHALSPLILIAFATLAGCKQPAAEESGPRPVKLAEVTALGRVEKTFRGVLSASQFSDLAFKMSGPLVTFDVSSPRSIPSTSSGSMKPRKPLSKLQRPSCNAPRSSLPAKPSPARNMKPRKPLMPMPRLPSSMPATPLNKPNCVLPSTASYSASMWRTTRRYNPDRR